MKSFIGWRTWSFSIALLGYGGVLSWLNCLTPEAIAVSTLATTLYTVKKYQDYKKSQNGNGVKP